jgi:catechol 2,3-dioxygenase-like lactoylglutathione lyase family enzyme
MLGSSKLVAFVGTADAKRARAFYADVLGLRLVSEDDFALVFDAGGAPLRVAIMPKVAAAPYTVLGWQVPDVRSTIDALVRRGVQFERYGFMLQDDLGVWTAPSGARVAWFKDPDGNLLSLTQL